MYDLREFLKPVQGTCYNFKRSNFRCRFKLFQIIYSIQYFRITDVVFVSGVTVFNIVSEEKYENEMVLVFTNRFRPFSPY
jgi:hypothetical protein